MLEKHWDSQAKVEIAVTEEGDGARVCSDPESDVELNGEPVDGNLVGDDKEETVVQNTGTIQKKAPTKVYFGDAKFSDQQPLPHIV